MKFSAVLLASALSASSNVDAFSFSNARTSTPTTLRAATLDAPSSETTAATSPASVADGGGDASSSDAASMVEKSWPVADFVKDSDRVLP